MGGLRAYADPHRRYIGEGEVRGDGLIGVLIHSFFAYDPAFRGGVRVAAVDVEGMARSRSSPAPDLAAARTCACWTAWFQGKGLDAFMAYDPAFSGMGSSWQDFNA